jgi:hypothetical protein
MSLDLFLRKRMDYSSKERLIKFKSMKTKLFYLFILVLWILILFSYGCKKNEKNAATEIQTQPPSQNPMDLKLARMYTTFKHKGSLKLKDGENMTVDSSIWYLQGTANFTYGNASQQKSKIVIDSTFITLMLTDGTITLTEVWNKYSNMIDSIRANYQKIVGNNVQLMSVQVQRSQLTETELVCKVTSIFSPGIFQSQEFCEFNNVDYWIWWNWSGQGGICGGPNQNQGNGLDAAQLINQKIMNCMGVPYGNYYWSDLETVDLEPWDYPNPNWGGIDHNYEEYLMYCNYEGYSNFHGCLTPDECNFYLNGTKWVATVAKSQGGARPDNKSFISIAIHGDETSDPNYPYNSTYLHHGPAYYGILHWNPNPPLPM